MEMTSGLTLIAHVWAHQKCQGWDGLNHSMLNALTLAIGAQLEFEASDIKHIESNFRPGYWLGEHRWEYPYAMAVSVGNRSFITAIEDHLKREPFFGNQVEPVCSQGYTHSTSERARERLTCWSRVYVDGQPGEVTSINNERVVVTLRECGEKYPRRILKLTHEKCREIWPAPKKKKAKAEVQQ